MDKKIRAIIFDDEFAILGKVKWENDKPVGKQVENFKVQSLIALIDKEIIGEDESFKEPVKGDKVPYKQFVETSLKSHTLARNHLRAEQREKLRAY